MKNLKDKILEGLKVNSKSKFGSKNWYSDEELRKDYTDVEYSIYKSEKQEFAEKYGASSCKIKDIQLVILNELRSNRNKKSVFDDNDVHDFYRFNPPEKYDKLVEYLDKEPIKFIEYLLSYWDNRTKKLRKKPSLSINDKYCLRNYDKIKKYLDEHNR